MRGRCGRIFCPLQQNEAISEVDEIRAGNYRTRDHACMSMQPLYVVMQHRLRLRTTLMDSAELAYLAVDDRAYGSYFGGWEGFRVAES